MVSGSGICCAVTPRLRLINARNGNACKIFKSSDLPLQIVEASPA
jgi:hypothetical protein